MYVQYIFIRKKERKRNAKQRKREREGGRERERVRKDFLVDEWIIKGIIAIIIVI